VIPSTFIRYMSWRSSTKAVHNNWFNRSRGPRGFCNQAWFAALRLTVSFCNKKPIVIFGTNFERRVIGVHT
jgi:hypothetical protein